MYIGSDLLHMGYIIIYYSFNRGRSYFSCPEQDRPQSLKGTYDDGEFNMRSYDLFNVLAGSNPASGDFNMLRYDYQGDPYDSHPNHTANAVVAADFTTWLSDLVW